MICYHHLDETSPPPWLVGARDLACRPDPTGGYAFGIGPSYLLGQRTGAVMLSNGWSVWINGSIDVPRLRRDVRWCNLAPAEDIAGNAWAAPAILDGSGERGFRVKYGPTFRPALTAEQDAAMILSREARALLINLYHAKKDPTEDEQAAMCAWAADLLSIANHITPEVLGMLQILDDSLVTAVLAAATSADLVLVPNG